MKICKYCEAPTQDESVFCSKCGAKDFKYVCDNCGNIYGEGEFCPKCGVKHGQKAKCCPKCGAEYFSFACPDCGYVPVKAEQATVCRETPQVIINNRISNNTINSLSNQTIVHKGRCRNKWTAFFLCLFLGYLGIHKFYEGKVGKGFLYMFTCGLCGIGWLIDILALLFKSNPYYV